MVEPSLNNWTSRKILMRNYKNKLMIWKENSSKRKKAQIIEASLKLITIMKIRKVEVPPKRKLEAPKGISLL